jgi:regulator of sigma E protease
MLQGILIFIIFLGPLIFFHELGHFFFARLFGVRVEVFSIGFGPKIFKVLRNGTEYAISAIPLGGYVKMFGDDPFSETPLSEEEKKYAFNHKTKWARFWIVFGGPLANFILAYFLYVGLLAGGEKVPEIKVGVVKEESILFSKGIRTGDVLVGINDEKVTSFDDFNIKGAKVEQVSVRRNDGTVTLPIDMGIEEFVENFLSLASAVRRPIVVDSKGQKYYLSAVKNPSELSASFEEISSSFSGELYLYSFNVQDEKYELILESELLLSNKDLPLMDSLLDKGFYPLDLAVKNVVMSSPASKIGLRKDDILIKLGDVRLKNFEDLRSTLQLLGDGQSIQLTFISQGKEFTKEIIPEVKEVDKKKTKLVGIESAAEFIPPRMIEVREETLSGIFIGAINRTWDGVVKTFSGYKKLITREVSLNNIGGPLAIGKVASDSFNIGLSMFFRLMAIISINLGVINLFPIPVLDGGHIMFLLFETLNGGPLSRRKLEIAQRMGVSFLFLLIFIALFNDISRFF